MREADERDDGYIPGSRHIPYRLVARSPTSIGTAAGGDDLRDGRARGIAASVLAAHGVDARPVLDGGMDDWGDAAKRAGQPRRAPPPCQEPSPDASRRDARS